MKDIKQNIPKKRDHQKSYGYGTIQFSEAKILLARQGKFTEDCLETQKTKEIDFSLFYNLKAPQSDANGRSVDNQLIAEIMYCHYSTRSSD